MVALAEDEDRLLARVHEHEKAFRGLIDAAEAAYSEMAFAVQDIAGRRLDCEAAIDQRSKRLAAAADNLRKAIERVVR